MSASRTITATPAPERTMRFTGQGRFAPCARLNEPRFILLHDHARLPGRFFGRMTASIQAELTG